MKDSKFAPYTENVTSSQVELGLAPRGTLRKVDLAGANLSGADLTRVVLTEVSLAGADLTNAILCGATLEQVDLTGATLTGADLRGATLMAVKLDGAALDGVDARGAVIERSTMLGGSARGADLSGATVVKVELAEMVIEQLRASGADFQQVDLRDVALLDAGLDGIHGIDVQVTGCRLERCDLSAVHIEESTFRETALVGVTWTGATLRRLRFRRTTWVEGTASGLLVERCSGLTRALEATLLAEGAVVAILPIQRLTRLLRRSLSAQLSLAVGFVLTVVLGLLLVRTPSLWPTALLFWRYDELNATHPDQRCDRVTPIGEALASRRIVDFHRQLWIIEDIVHCHVRAGRLDEGAALLDVFGANLGDRPRWRLTEQLAEARFLHAAEQDDEAFAKVASLADRSTVPEERLEVLAVAELFLRDQGAEPREGPLRGWEAEAALIEERCFPRSERERCWDLELADRLLVAATAPSEVVHGHRWVGLQLARAQAALARGGRLDMDLGEVPVEIMNAGLWDLALRLLTEIGLPAVDERVRGWVSNGLRRLEESGRTEEADAIGQRLWASTFYEGDADAAWLVRLQVELMRIASRFEAALALLDGVDAQPTELPLLCSWAALLRARVELDLHLPDRAVAALATLPTAEELPAEVLDERTWLTAEAQIQLGQEMAVLQTLEPLFVGDRASGGPNIARLEALLPLFEDSDIASRILEALVPGGTELREGLFESHLLILRQLAEKQELTKDQSGLDIVLRDGSVNQVVEASSMLLGNARARSEVPLAVAFLTERAEAYQDPERREALARILQDDCVQRDDIPGAATIGVRLGVAESADESRRLQQLEFEIRAALLDPSAESAGQVLLRWMSGGQPPPLETAEHFTGVIVERLQADKGWRESIELARSVRDKSSGDGGSVWLDRAIVRALLAVGNRAELDAELRSITARRGACRASVLETDARRSLGVSGSDNTAILQACGSTTSRPSDHLEAARLLLDGGLAVSALEQIELAVVADPSEEFRMEALELRVAALDRQQDHDGAIRSLWEVMALESEPIRRQRIASLLIEQEGRRGSPASLSELYRKLAADPTLPDQEGLWRLAAEWLEANGAPEAVLELGGREAWQLVRRTVEEDEWLVLHRDFEQAIARGEHEEAWLGVQRFGSEPRSVEERLRAYHAVREPAIRLGQGPALLSFGEAVAAELARGSDPRQRLELDMARVQLDIGSTEGLGARVLALLEEPASPDITRDARTLLVSVEVRGGRSDKLLDILDLWTGDGLDNVEEFALRTFAAGELLDAGHTDLAKAAMLPLQGRAMDLPLASRHYETITKVGAAGGPEGLIDLPERFPVTGVGGSCLSWMAVVRASDPAWSGSRDIARRAAAGCESQVLSVWDVIILADFLERSGGGDGLVLLERFEADRLLPDVELGQLQIGRARLLLARGKVGGAAKQYAEVAENCRIPGQVWDALRALVDLAGAHEEAREFLTEPFLVDCRACLGKLPGEEANLLRHLATFYTLQRRFEEAERWQRELLEIANDDLSQLLADRNQLAWLLLRTSSDDDFSWMVLVNRVLIEAPADSPARHEALRLLLVGAAREARIGGSNVQLDTREQQLLGALPLDRRLRIVEGAACELDSIGASGAAGDLRKLAERLGTPSQSVAP